MTKDVDNIKVSQDMPQELIDKLKQSFPYGELYANTEDALRGIKTLYKHPQNNSDWHNYYLNKSKQYEKKAKQYKYLAEYRNESKSKSSFSDILSTVFRGFIFFGVGALIGCGIHELINFIF